VDHLQELDGELDVAQSPGSELDVAIGLAVGDVGDHAAPHGACVLDEPVTTGGLPHPGGDHVLEGVPDLLVAGDHTRLE
jgi:hypothetical protein